jgi:hypothetical protein
MIDVGLGNTLRNVSSDMAMAVVIAHELPPVAGTLAESSRQPMDAASAAS